MKNIFFTFLFLMSSVLANDDSYAGDQKTIDQSKLNWIIDRHDTQSFRGGTTIGVIPEIDLKPSNYFEQLSKARLAKEKDRLAILSMTGNFRANFEFTEMFGSEPQYELDNPYKSWGTEVVKVIENNENFISLQHIIVMYFEGNDNKKIPHVMKHWRQDWAYEDSRILTYQSGKNWKNSNIDHAEGTWSQTVYQVDDTPRYESFGKWVHGTGASRWVSQTTPRPLPRREFSIRSDYDLLSGINKITVMSWGWIMEEVNDKVKITNNFIGSEYGIARYQRIKNYDFKPAEDYWISTKKYWKSTRDIWTNLIRSKNKICLHSKVDGKPSYVHYFSQADRYSMTNDESILNMELNQLTQKFIKKTCEI